MSQAIYPAPFAAMLTKRAGEKYRPSNGTEGECFFEAWCRHCQRDKAMREGVDLDDCDDTERCDIIADTFSYDVEDAKYPTAWQYGKDGQPCCTAFISAGEQIPTPRCTKTLELF
nr:hypothetical protein [Dechloromonas sp.]